MDEHADDSSTEMSNKDGHGKKTTPQPDARGKPIAAGAELRRVRRHCSASSTGTFMAPTAPTAAPCGACKFLRRRCVSGCVFAPHFGSDHGAARFAAVHKVFGASNVSKLLHHVPPARRGDAVATICYEAQARLSDPVYGCVSTIIALQQQVASLHAELSIVQMQLVGSRMAAETAARCSQRQQHVTSLQPAYSNTSSASNNFPSVCCSFPSGLGFPAAAAAAAPPRGLEVGTLRLSQPSSLTDGAGGQEDGREAYWPRRF